MHDSVTMKLIDWSKKNDDIRLLILEGSRGANSKLDEFSDYDINVYTADIDKYASHNEWIYSFGEVVVYQKENLWYNDLFIPTRLTVYKNQPRIDFSFWPISVLDTFRDETYEPYKNGFIVLLDKDGLSFNIPKPTYRGFEIVQPDEDEYQKNIYNFYFEAYIVVKYLKRENLWVAKYVENDAIKSYLLKVLCWLEYAKNPETKKNFRIDGKWLEKSVNEETQKRISCCFSGYDSDETWRSLNSMILFFKDLNKEYAEIKGYVYPEKKIGEMMEFLNGLYISK